MSARQPLARCPVCGGSARKPWLAALGFELVRCAACGHRYSTELHAGEHLAREYYNESDAALAERSVASLNARFEEYAAILSPRFPEPGRVLDIGCNAGELLALFAARGWQVAGVEISPGPAARARATLNAPIWEGPVEQVLPATERFDLVAMTHVLEHIPSPAGVLAQVRGALAPRGKLLLEVPNADDFLLRVWRGGYRPLCPGDHASFFDARSLTRLLKDHGFSVESIASPIHARDIIYSSILSAIDTVRAVRARPNGDAAPAGVQAQLRYRGGLRRPLRRWLDATTAALDPFARSACKRLETSVRGPVLIVLASPATRAS